VLRHAAMESVRADEEDDTDPLCPQRRRQSTCTGQSFSIHGAENPLPLRDPPPSGTHESSGPVTAPCTRTNSPWPVGREQGSGQLNPHEHTSLERRSQNPSLLLRRRRSGVLSGETPPTSSTRFAPPLPIVNCDAVACSRGRARVRRSAVGG
jgi:hypothetical protein